MECKTQVEESNSEEDFLAKYLDPKDRTRRIPVKITFFLSISTLLHCAKCDKITIVHMPLG